MNRLDVNEAYNRMKQVCEDNKDVLIKYANDCGDDTIEADDASYDDVIAKLEAIDDVVVENASCDVGTCVLVYTLLFIHPNDVDANTYSDEEEAKRFEWFSKIYNA